MSKELQIRNSTAEFLIFQAEDKAQGVQVFYKDETIWASQKAIAALFDCSTDNVSLHLKNIFESGELQPEATTEKISVVQTEGERQVTRSVLFYKLDASSNRTLTTSRSRHCRSKTKTRNRFGLFSILLTFYFSGMEKPIDKISLTHSHTIKQAMSNNDQYKNPNSQSGILFSKPISVSSVTT